MKIKYERIAYVLQDSGENPLLAALGALGKQVRVRVALEIAKVKRALVAERATFAELVQGLEARYLPVDGIRPAGYVEEMRALLETEFDIPIESPIPVELDPEAMGITADQLAELMDICEFRLAEKVAA